MQKTQTNKRAPAVACTVFRGWQEVPVHILAQGKFILLNFMELKKGYTPPGKLFARLHALEADGAEAWTAE